MSYNQILCADYLERERLYRISLADTPFKAIAYEDNLENVAQYAREHGYLLVVF